MAQQPTRSILAMIFRNFINSLRPRQISGDLKGTDSFGNKFFEIPANPSLGKRRASRWFEPAVKEDFDQEMASEWESWLRGRRTEPPTEDELNKNYAVMQMKKKNAIEVEAKAGKMTPKEKGFETFPKHEEYEVAPGQKPNEK